MIKQYLTIISSLVFTATTGIIYPLNTKAIEDIEPVEVVSMRSEYEKHYDNGDGTYTAYIYTVPLHYYENGEWLDIDNTLIQDENGKYVNRSNSMKVTLSPETSISTIDAISETSDNNNQMVSVDYNGYSLSWSLIDTTSENKPIVMSEDIKETENTISSEEIYPVSKVSINEQESIEKDIGMNKLNDKISESVSTLNSSVFYNDISESIDCKIDIQSNSVKETLIIENPDNFLEEYSYFIQSDGLVAELYEDNSVIFSDGEENVFTIPAPFMFDSSENSDNNYNIKVTLEESDNGYIYTLSPDMNWLTDEARVYPVMIDPTVKASYHKLSFSYNSEANPYASYTNDYFYVGNESKNSYQAFSTFDNSFNGFGNNPTVLGAYMYVTPIYSNLNNSMTIKVNPIISKIESKSWNSSNNGDGLSKINKDSVSFSVSPTITDRCTVNITNFIQYAINNSYTSNDDIGYKLYGFKFSSSSGSRGTVKFCNDSKSDNRPFYTIIYTDSANYTLPYAPEKYDNNSKETYSSNTYVFNFQNRMNCYAYALQVYCNEKQIPYMTYKLYPGEFGISSGKTTDKYKINNFLDLTTFYTNFADRYSVEGLTGMAKQIILKEYSDFVEEQMYKDARALNFSINKYSNSSVIKNNKFTLPTSFDENKGRIIAMMVYKVTNSSILDYHFYLRNGNGTCPNGHGDTCSMWSHKPGTLPVTNCPTTNYNVKLCDANIQEYAYKSRNMSEEIKTNVKYFNITKDTNIYTSAHDNGQYDNCTGTLYYGN